MRRLPCRSSKSRELDLQNGFGKTEQESPHMELADRETQDRTGNHLHRNYAGPGCTQRWISERRMRRLVPASGEKPEPKSILNWAWRQPEDHNSSAVEWRDGLLQHQSRALRVKSLLPPAAIKGVSRQGQCYVALFTHTGRTERNIRSAGQNCSVQRFHNRTFLAEIISAEAAPFQDSEFPDRF